MTYSNSGVGRFEKKKMGEKRKGKRTIEREGRGGELWTEMVAVNGMYRKRKMKSAVGREMKEFGGEEERYGEWYRKMAR